MSPAVRITPELLASWLTVSDPQIAPDGSIVAYVLTPTGRTGEHPTSEIWCVNTDGTNERRLTFGKGADAAPRWSPDSRTLAFTSDRAKPEIAQLYLLPRDGGEARQVTQGKASVNEPKWSPDGRLIAFLRKDEPSEEEEREKKDRKDWIIADENLKRARLFVVDTDGGEPRQVSPDGNFHVRDFCWHPNSQDLAAVTTESPLLAEQRRPNTILKLSINPDSEPETMFTSSEALDSPQWSPDGSSIALLGTAGRVKTGDQLFLLDVEKRNLRLLTPNYEGSVYRVSWLDAGMLLFTALEDMWGAVNLLNVKNGKWKPVLAVADRRRGGIGDGLSTASSGSFVLTRSTSNRPPQVYLGKAGEKLRQLTTANSQLQALPFRPAQTLTWTASDGTEIHGLLTTPALGTKPFPTVLVIHGGPASAFSERFAGNWHDWAQLLAANGYAVVMPNPRGSTGRGAAFTDAEVGDIGGREVEDDLRGLDLAIEMGIADPNRCAVAGWSHGGYMTAWLVTQTDRFKAGVMGAGLCNMVSDQGTNDIPGFNLDYFYEDYADLYANPAILWDRSPLKHVTNVKTPTLILHGANDDRVAASQGREFYRALKSLNVATKMVTYPREPHGFREREHQIDVQRQILAWLERWV